ncbi:hypothetical protein [Carnobacterium maltaromaticum]|uniref:hypothetical protein n=1 Tax=Carnobacterium maltaromaticum TaxID=2751 RepID=UPI00191B9D69|nr:hypothetical protein [Carnobacterium maltaromaticum]CAD5901254.1 conserved hypothetical protein [Carnobacterium maltaromaticum]
MKKRTIRFYKPKYVSMLFYKKDNLLIYEWQGETLELDYIKCQNQLKQLLQQFKINVNHYLSLVNLSKSRYYKTMKNTDDNPITNFKIRLIYLHIKMDYQKVRSQYILTYYILKTNLVSVDQYVHLSNLTKQTIYQLRNKNKRQYRYATYRKLESANEQIQQNILATLKKTDIKRYNNLAPLTIIDFFQNFNPST